MVKWLLHSLKISMVGFCEEKIENVRNFNKNFKIQMNLRQNPIQNNVVFHTLDAWSE